MKKTYTFLSLIFVLFNTMAQVTQWALPFKPNSTANSVTVSDVELDASGNIFATGSFKGTVNFNFNGTASNVTSAGGYDIFLARYNSSGALQWVKTIGGTADDISVAVDLQGTSIAIAGTFVSANVDFDPGAGTNVLTSSGLTDIFVAKFDNAGAHAWAKRAGGTQGELVTDVEFDGNSNVFIAGSFTTLMDFFSNTNTSSNGARDAFVCKLDVNGVYSWVKTIGGAGTDVSNKLTVYGSNSVLLCVDIGYAAGSTTFNPGSGTSSFTFSGTSGTNGIVSDFSSSGTYGNTFHFKGNSHMVKMMASNNENIAIGTFTGTMDIDPTAGTTNVTGAGASNMFMVQTGFATSGSFIAYGVVNGIGSSDAIYPSNVVMKVGVNYQTDLYVTGYAKGAINFGGTAASDLQGYSSNDYSFYVKFNHDFAANKDFELKYAYKNAFASGTGSAEASRGNGLALNATSGDVVVAGYYYSTYVPPAGVVFNPGNVSATQTFSTASMGYLQYINGCAIPTTTAVANDYSICSGTSATLSVSGATTYSWNTGSTATTFTVSPPTTTTYTVTGSNGLCTKTDTVKVTVAASPTTVAGAIDYSLCAGQNTNLLGSGGLTYSWSTGSTSTNINVAPTSTTTYTLTASMNGCSKTDTVRIVVTALPNIIGIAADYSICAGQTANLSASGATTFSWNTGATTAGTTATPTATTTYTVTGTTTGCSKTDTVRVLVTSLPSVTASTANYSICSGTTATLLAGGNALSYSWNTGATTVSINVNPTITTTYTLTGTNTGGCSKTDTVKVTIKPLPGTSATAQDYSLCNGQYATLNASGATTYSWNTGSTASTIAVTPASTTTYTLTGTTNGCSKTDTVKVSVDSYTLSISPASASICAGSGNNAIFTASGASTYSWTSGPATASYTVSPSVTTTYTVTSTSAAGCTKTATAVVTVSNAAVINVTPASPTICTGGSGTTLTASGANSYTWTSGPATATYSVNPTSTTTYTVTGTATGGCTGNTTVTVNVANPPTVSASTQNPSICEGSSTTLFASGADSYSWNTGSTGSSTMVSPLSTTSYTVEGTSADGCVATATVNVTVNTIPSVSVMSNDPVLTAVETGASYQWYNCLNNQPIQGETAQSYTSTANGDYKVAVTKNGCSDTSACVNISTTGISNRGINENYITIAPNPATNFIMFTNTGSGSYIAQMIDISGKIVLEKQITDQIEQVDVSALSNGIYYVKIFTQEKVSTLKLVINK